MKNRFNYTKVAPGVYEAMDAVDSYLQGSGLEKGLLLLVQLRASQINGCAYCLDMHWKDLRASATPNSGFARCPPFANARTTPTASAPHWNGRRPSPSSRTGTSLTLRTRRHARTSLSGNWVISHSA